ncbi:MAG: 2-C-methyl-D-erythritol 4-phosphate cytidylyltransferase [Firmicutes bacterium]|nr:2-C-methyl-D-erythritol 4-phosphate cytidylyltransferase [Bacillota bacterium]
MRDNCRNIALILSGGTGTRFGSDIPKQYLSVCGTMILTETLQRFYSHPQIHALQIVAAPAWQDIIQKQQEPLAGYKAAFRGFSLSGETRQLSILNGLRDISSYAEEEDIVLIHDAARPLVSSQLISNCLAAIQGHDGVMPALPMSDTVYLSHDGKQVTELLKREQVVAGQAPEAFRLGKYLKANEALLPERIYSIRGSTEPAILAGMDIAIIPGDPGNFKITTKEDLKRYQTIRCN